MGTLLFGIFVCSTSSGLWGKIFCVSILEILQIRYCRMSVVSDESVLHFPAFCELEMWKRSVALSRRTFFFIQPTGQLNLRLSSGRQQRPHQWEHDAGVGAEASALAPLLWTSISYLQCFWLLWSSPTVIITPLLRSIKEYLSSQTPVELLHSINYAKKTKTKLNSSQENSFFFSLLWRDPVLAPC